MVSYYYDGKNRRVKKDLASGTDVLYINHGWQELEEREWDTNGEGTEDDKWEPRRQYVYGPTYVDEVLIFDKDTDSDGDCTDGEGSSRYFYAQQANWNVVAVTDSSGDTAERIKYDPYGEATVSVQPGHSSTGNPYLFQSRRWDSEVSLYYFRNRVMSPVLGRFLQRDPHVYADQISLYEYAGSSPCVSIDPLGEYWITFELETGKKTRYYVPDPCGEWEYTKGEWVTLFVCKGDRACCEKLYRELPKASGYGESGDWNECPGCTKCVIKRGGFPCYGYTGARETAEVVKGQRFLGFLWRRCEAVVTKMHAVDLKVYCGTCE